MAIFESLFDITYLCLVLALGIRLLLVQRKGAKLFGVMAILLGAGDAFHLIPRVISHLSPGGFEAHGAALSWGQFITGITMTVFYILFYHYYRDQSGDRDNRKRNLIYILALIRIVLVLLPQNNWGSMPGNYMLGIYRNIPFAILGAFLIFWTYQQKDKPALKHMSLLIFFSFAFYIPVVLWSDAYPVIGALMMPKTVAYLMIVVLGYRFFVPRFEATNLLALSLTLLAMGLIGGVFYREFTKFYNYDAATHLGKLHVHTLVLGFLTLFILYSIAKKYDNKTIEGLKKPLRIYLGGLTFTLANMTVFGIWEVVDNAKRTINIHALSGTSGLGHIALSIGLVWLLLRLLKIEMADKNIREQLS